MDPSTPAPQPTLQGVLGYLNFSTGRPDPRIHKQLNDAFATAARQDHPAPWRALHDWLRRDLDALRTGSSAFQDAGQAAAVLDLVFARLLPAYRAHHADLLAHQSDALLFQPGFLARACEAVLAQGPPWDEDDRLLHDAIAQLNDYVGYRPIAILETRPRGEPYAHEKVRPVPLYLRGVGALAGPYDALIARTIEVFHATPPHLLADASFDLALLDELALDPRAYDHAHPVDKRPNYRFGEWDPHHIDNQGRYRRYVARQPTLDGLLDRVRAAPDGLSREELMQEAAIVCAGTLLMATGVSGATPQTHDSSTTLNTLVQHIARYREAFYVLHLQASRGQHGERLRQEARTTRQPFGGARQHLNQYLARLRATQLQQRHLALLLARMGCAEASRGQAARIEAASVRFLSEMHILLTAGELAVERGDLAAAAEQPGQVDELIQRGIDCGALVDPWNILGFQGLFPLFHAQEDAVSDNRVGQLVQVIERLLNLSSRLVSEAAAVGQDELGGRAAADMRRLATWWDRFASVEVNDVRRVHGGEALASAEHVARALTSWRERGAATADLAFWRQHLEGFRSPKAFALVVEALLRKQDLRAAMALLINWLGQVEQVPLEDGDYSFHQLALRWMMTACDPAAPQPFTLVRKFFDYLEANAEEFWRVPRLDVLRPEADDEEKEDLYSAAYEGVSYQDTTDDDVEGEVLDGGGPREFDLQEEADRLEKRLRFLSTVARLWTTAVRRDQAIPPDVARSPDPVVARSPDRATAEAAEVVPSWLGRARKNYQELLTLLDAIHEHPVEGPTGSYDSLVEFDRRRVIKERLLAVIIGTSLDTALAVGTLQGRLAEVRGEEVTAPGGDDPHWVPVLLRLDRALWRGEDGTARALVPPFLQLFQHEPLLFRPLAQGGHPRHVLRASLAQTILRTLAGNLPRLGLLRETYELVKTAQAMERTQPLEGPRVTEFDRLFEGAAQAVVEAVVDAALRDPDTPQRDEQLVEFLETLMEPFLALWMEHSRTLRVAVLETVREGEWPALCDFIQRYGRDLFHARFMTMANLRGILHGGVDKFLDYLRDNPDPLHPVKLIDELGDGMPRGQAERFLQIILQAVIENYEEYKDYNTTTPQSDYGDNLHLLLDFLRLKASYERHAWHLKPLLLVHEVLARRACPVAERWQEQLTRLTSNLAEQYLGELADLERQHGMRLRTVADRLGERFVKPLALDRLCALIEPVMGEVRSGGPGAAFARLEAELRPYAETPVGVGLDVPQWLRRLDAEVQRVQATRGAQVQVVEQLLRVPRAAVRLEDLQRQVQDWRKPRDSGSGAG